jgi:hypothetical protein
MVMDLRYSAGMGEVASVLEYLDDGVERPFLVTAVNRTLTDKERERYAAAIARRDPARAEWLRLERELHARAAADRAKRRRFDELCESLQCDWIRLLRRDSLLNCGRAVDKLRRIRFKFLCEQRWESLAPTEDPRVRACDSCRRRVYHCDRVSEAEARVLRGECVAMPTDLMVVAHGDIGTRHFLGRVLPLGFWPERLFPGE